MLWHTQPFCGISVALSFGHPNTVNSEYATRLQETDPRFGAEAALSAFDAQLKASATFNNNNRIYNNSFFAGGATFFQQDLNDYQVEVSKRTASGSLLAVRGVSDYDANKRTCKHVCKFLGLLAGR